MTPTVPEKKKRGRKSLPIEQLKPKPVRLVTKIKSISAREMQELRLDLKNLTLKWASTIADLVLADPAISQDRKSDVDTAMVTNYFQGNLGDPFMRRVLYLHGLKLKIKLQEELEGIAPMEEIKKLQAVGS